MTDISEFEEIRPYLDEELPQVIENLVADLIFHKVEQSVFPDMPMDAFAAKARTCKTKFDFQKAFCYPFLHNVIDRTTDGIQMDLTHLCAADVPCTYVSNHRDIVLDSGFLDIMMIDHERDTVEIAIGDNLLIYPWISWFVRINKSFIVQRQLSMRKMLESSIRLSRYMHYCINEKKQSIWIAQREGRAKDSDDRTQESVLKMCSMGGEGDVLDRLIQLNIVPLTVSYEYDPCDYLKAKEFQQKRDVPDFKKSPKDDLVNMNTGFLGYKGRILYRLSLPLNACLSQIDRSLPKSAIYQTIATMIDRDIHSNYELYPGNYVALDLLEGTEKFSDKYTSEEKDRFISYIQGQLAKIDLKNKDEAFLRIKLFQMYANPLKNYLATL